MNKQKSNPLLNKTADELENIYKKLSASKIKTFLECPRKFYYNYIDRLPRRDTEIFTFGSAVHYGLETVTAGKLSNPSYMTPQDYQNAYQSFREYMCRGIEDSTTINDTSLFNEGVDLITKELDRVNAEPVPEKVLAVEQEFDLEFPEGVRIYGFMDKVRELDSQTLLVTDYKTSRVPLSWEEARTDEQISMYDLACSVLYPQYSKIVLELNYLRLDKKVTSTRTDIERYSFRQQLLAIRTGLKKFVDSISQEPYESVPEGKLSPFCAYCDYKHNCSTYTESLIKIGSAFQIPEVTPESFVSIYKDVKNTIKELQQLEKDLKQWALVYLNSEEAELANDKEQAYTITKTSRVYDPFTLAKYLDMTTLLSCCNISNQNLDAVLQTLPSDVVAAIQQSAEYRLRSPELRTKKVKK